MRYSDPADVKKFGKRECVRSVFDFLANYVVLLALVVLFIWLNTLRLPGENFFSYMAEHFNTLVYLMASVFLLCFTIYFYYFFEDKGVLATQKSIWLIFLMLDVSILVCYFFGYFFNIYSRPVAMLALLALMLLGRRDAIFLNVIFALLMFAIDNFSNFSEINEYVNALPGTPLMAFSAGMIAIFVGNRVQTRLRSFLTGFAVCAPILLMVACLEFNRGMEMVYLLLFGLEAGILSAVFFMALLPVFEAVFKESADGTGGDTNEGAGIEFFDVGTVKMYATSGILASLFGTDIRKDFLIHHQGNTPDGDIWQGGEGRYVSLKWYTPKKDKPQYAGDNGRNRRIIRFVEVVLMYEQQQQTVCGRRIRMAERPDMAGTENGTRIRMGQILRHSEAGTGCGGAARVRTEQTQQPWHVFRKGKERTVPHTTDRD